MLLRQRFDGFHKLQAHGGHFLAGLRHAHLVNTLDGHIVILGPVAFDYNGPQPAPAILPVTGVTISDCDFGTPANVDQPCYLYNVKGLTLTNVTIAGRVHNTTMSA